MKKLLLLPILFFSISCFADVYTGSFATRLNNIRIKYEFDASNKNNLKGTFEAARDRRSSPCWSGIRSINGSKIDGVNVILIATPGAEQDGMSCTNFEFEGKVEGNTFVGKFTSEGDARNIVLTKE